MSFRDLLDSNPQYSIAGICISLGAAAHIAEEVRQGKWKGWINATADVVICGFAGFIFYQVAQATLPQYTYLYCSIGSFWGTKGFKYITAGIVDTLSTAITKYKEKN